MLGCRCVGRLVFRHRRQTGDELQVSVVAQCLPDGIPVRTQRIRDHAENVVRNPVFCKQNCRTANFVVGPVPVGMLTAAVMDGSNAVERKSDEKVLFCKDCTQHHLRE